MAKTRSEIGVRGRSPAAIPTDLAVAVIEAADARA